MNRKGSGISSHCFFYGHIGKSLTTTTGVSPFQMYSRARRPTYYIKVNLVRITIPMPVVDKPSEYLRKLKEWRKMAAEAADLTTTKQRRMHSTLYNLCLKEKAFEPGDRVLVCDTNRSVKMQPRRISPCTITEKYRQHSYHIEMPEGTRMLVHANNLQSYSCRAACIGVMCHDDHKFSEVEYAPCPSTTLTSVSVLPADCIKYLAPT